MAIIFPCTVKVAVECTLKGTDQNPGAVPSSIVNKCGETDDTISKSMANVSRF